MRCRAPGLVVRLLPAPPPSPAPPPPDVYPRSRAACTDTARAMERRSRHVSASKACRRRGDTCLGSDAPPRSCLPPPTLPLPLGPQRSPQPMLARVPREVSDAWHDRVPARLHLAWRVNRRGVMKSAHWAAPQRGCTAPPLQGANPNPSPNPNPTRPWLSLPSEPRLCLRPARGRLEPQVPGAAAAGTTTPARHVCACRLPRKSNSMLHASEATATYWADAAPSAPGGGCCAAHFLRPAIEVAPVAVCMAACNRMHCSL